MISDTLMQVLKNQVPREAEINDLEEVMKSQPLAKDPSESHLNQAVPPPTSIENMHQHQNLKMLNQTSRTKPHEDQSGLIKPQIKQ